MNERHRIIPRQCTVVWSWSTAIAAWEWAVTLPMPMMATPKRSEGWPHCCHHLSIHHRWHLAARWPSSTQCWDYSWSLQGSLLMMAVDESAVHAPTPSSSKGGAATRIVWLILLVVHLVLVHQSAHLVCGFIISGTGNALMDAAHCQQSVRIV